ncbi:MAG: hypothetical protein QM800_02585 [Paludibacter sp.]
MKKTIFYITVLLFAFTLPVGAVDYTWNGNTSSLFGDSLNWTPKWSNPLAPSSTENVIIVKCI